MSEHNELALVLSRIQALSKSKTSTATVPELAVDGSQDDGIPVLTDIYQGQDALTAVALEHIFAAAGSASDSQADHYQAQQRAESELQSSDQAVAQPTAALEPLFTASSADSSIRFLPVEDEIGQALENMEDAARDDLVAAVLEDIQPVMSDVIRQALIREVQVLGPRLSAELEAALSENVRLRVLGALKNEKSSKD